MRSGTDEPGLTYLLIGINVLVFAAPPWAAAAPPVARA